MKRLTQITAVTDFFRSGTAPMKHLAVVTLMLNLGAAGIYAHQAQVNVKLKASGTNVATTIDLQPGTITDEVNFAGRGTLGPFTYRELHADTLSPQSSSTCVDGAGLYFPTLAGGGVFRFQDGSLLNIVLTEGSLCVDLTAGVAHFTGAYKITGGTRRFKSASGALTLSSTVNPVLFNASGNPALLTNAGEFEGTIVGVTGEEE
ncbi:MAG TPA: hypothetical protein VGE93_00105, partial [Bryobacteraceae bacterium]